jgi:rfaE bifunctional protein nucleotidyltransferase chain/domain
MGQTVTVEHLDRAGLCGHRPGRKVVLTNGCFDVLTPAHFDLIQFAAAQGDVLIVAVNTDAAVSALKGPNRPIHGERDRAACVSRIEGVDYVVLFGTSVDPSVERLVERIEPDVLVKGGNYRLDEVVGRAFVERQGGRVVVSPERPGVSTTATLDKLDALRTEPPQRRVVTDVRPDGSFVSEPVQTVAPAGNWRVLLDLDGVLVDFVGEIMRRLCPGKSYRDFEGCYDLAETLGVPTDLYSMVGPDFWESCPWMPDGQAILRAAVTAVGSSQVYLCSSPTHESSSAMGKLRWIEHHLGDEWLRRYVFTPVKQLCAGPDVILIDDCDDNLEAFDDAGGRSVAVSRPWNDGWGLSLDAGGALRPQYKSVASQLKEIVGR